MEVFLIEEDKKALELEVEEYIETVKSKMDSNHPNLCNDDKELILDFFKRMKTKDLQACKLVEKENK